MIASRTAVAEVYDDCHEDLERLAGRFARRYRQDPEEVFGEARRLFLVAHRAYQPDRTPFDRWVRYRVWKGLLEQVRAYARKAERLTRRWADLDAIGRPCPGYGDPLAGLTPDARTVAGLVLDPPDGIAGYILTHTPSGIRAGLRNYLGARGWTAARVRRAFRELRGGLDRG